jgi:hypothetical protein
VRYTARPDPEEIGGDTTGILACNRTPAANRVGGSAGCQLIHSSATRGNASQPETYTTGGPDDIGTYLCFFTRVQNPTQQNNDDTVWRYSDMDCARAGISPRVQIWGYDARVVGKINTSTNFVDSLNYGSWGEYGLFSNGANTDMASGSGLLAGSPSTNQGTWSDLTFANRNPAGDEEFGRFGGLTQPIVDDTASGGCDSTPSGEVYGAGTKCVIRIDGELTITNNITYQNAGYNSVGEIPRVIIIADDIKIAPGVTQIDAWLVARDRSPTTGPVQGRISTCSQATDGTGDTYTNDVTNLRGNMCNQRLVFNGPVIADSIYLHRTTTPGTTQDVAAEVFNLRADAFLSSYAGPSTVRPVATTDLVKELPPRF